MKLASLKHLSIALIAIGILCGGRMLSSQELQEGCWPVEGCDAFYEHDGDFVGVSRCDELLGAGVPDPELGAACGFEEHPFYPEGCRTGIYNGYCSAQEYVQVKCIRVVNCAWWYGFVIPKGQLQPVLGWHCIAYSTAVHPSEISTDPISCRYEEYEEEE